MNATIRAAAEGLGAALGTVPGIRVYQNVGDSIDPPGAIVGPPRLTWRTGCVDPIEATFLVYLVVAFGDRAVEELWDLVGPVSAAIDGTDFAAVTEASPGTWPSGQSRDLPAYEITVDVSL